MSQSRKIVRRMASDSHVAAGEHNNAHKEYRRRQRTVQARSRRAASIVVGLLHALGHATYEPTPPVIALDRYHARIGVRGTTISPPNFNERNAYFAAKRGEAVV